MIYANAEKTLRMNNLIDGNEECENLNFRSVDFALSVSLYEAD